MTDYTPNFSEENIEETRRKKMEEFRRAFDPNAIRGEYDDVRSAPDPAVTADAEDASLTATGSIPAPTYVEIDSEDAESVTSYSTDDTPLRRRKKDEEINSFSDVDTRMRIERDSKKALRDQRREEKRIEKSKAKRNRRVFKWVWLSMIAIVAVILSQFAIVGMNDLLAISRSDNVRTVTVSVPANPTIDTIADLLYDNGVISRPTFFKMYTRLTSSEKGFRQGEFKLDTNKDYEAIINTLQSNASRTDIVTVQITEGMSIWEMVNLLHDEGVTTDIYRFLELCNSDEFDEDYTFLSDISTADVKYYTVDGHKIADSYKLEGYLFPDTYYFYLGEDPILTIGKMLSNYENKVIYHKERYFADSKKTTLSKEAENTDYSLRKILIIASIIQAEAADKEDMYYISSILHNRLTYGDAYGASHLDCDSTVFYPWRSQTDVPESLRSSYDSRYDTYTFDGLPDGPVCNPGVEAIKAALRPYSTDYLYFCHDKPENGSTPHYAQTLEEHEENLRLIGR